MGGSFDGGGGRRLSLRGLFTGMGWGEGGGLLLRKSCLMEWGREGVCGRGFVEGGEE